MVIDNVPHGYRRERDRHERTPVSLLIGGAVLALYGFALLLDNLGLGDVRSYVHHAWPAVLVIAGITLLIHRDANRNCYAFWGTVSIFAGLWVYASQHDWIHRSFGPLIGPAMLALIGASFVYRSLQCYDADRQIVLRRY